jgi:hypothetical protein
MALLRDDFEDGVVGPQWYDWYDTDVTLAETGGHLAVQLPAGSADTWGGYSSAALFDLTGSALEAEVSQVGGVDTVLEVRSWDLPRAQLLVEAGSQLIAAVYDTADEGVRAMIDYDGTAQRYWRIREQDGTMYWQYSSDRSDWMTLHSESNPFPPGDVHGIVAGGGQLAAAASELRYEQVNPDPAGAGYCPTTDFSDGFTAGELRPRWDPWSATGCTITPTGGALVMAFTGDPDVWCGASTFHHFDLRDSAVVIEMDQVPSLTQFVTYAQVMKPRDDTTRFEIGMESGTIWFEQDVADTSTDYADTTWSAADHRFWRFSAVGTEVHLDTSPNGTDWTPQLTATAGFDVSQVDIVVGSGNYASAAIAPATVRINGVNAP